MSTPRFTMWVGNTPAPPDPATRSEQAAKRAADFAECGGWRPQSERGGPPPSLSPLGRKLLGLDDW